VEIQLQFKLTEEQEMIRDVVRRMSKEKVASRAAEIDEKGEFPWDIIELYRENQIFGMPIPVEYGGTGAGSVTCCLVLEEIAKICASSAHALGGHWLGFTPLKLFFNEEQKKRYFPELLTKLVAFSLTEPGAGSDVGGIKTRAVLKDGEYVLNGTKCFCTNGSVADYIVIFARTGSEKGSKGLSAFFVEKGTPGLSVGKIENQMGMRGTPACELILEDCAVPKENLIGKEGEGFKIAMQTFDRTRPKDAVLAVGIAQGALEYAINYAKERVQFSRPIAQFQGIRFMLADMATETEAARQLVYTAASLIDQNTPDTMISSMCNYFATDVAMKVTSDAIQVLGGYGYMKEYPLERMFRDAKLLQIVEGTNQIQRVIVSNQLLA